ncbi:flagellar hook-associated protein FlgK [Alphaproteobacteria bacterium]|nr:flagellar hook-associated protein FlgK [Alphaproteobacteria bacterium]
MGLSSLNAALSGLRVAQQQINVISNNVSNVGTPGFSRKILPQASQAINGQTVGVRANTIIRQVDISLERDLWTQTSRVGFYDVQSQYLSRIEAFHGPPSSELSVASEIGRLKNEFDAFPEVSTASIVNQAVDTAKKFNDLSDLITTLRNDAQDEIALTVNRINDLLEQVAELNDQIESQINVGRSSAVTEDKRSGAIEELAELIDISFFQRGDGVIVVQTNQGVELASDRATFLTFSSNPQSATTFYPDPSSAAFTGGVYVGDPNTNPAAFDIAGREPGGKLGGLINLRDQTFPKQMAQLDEVAHKMALRFESQGLRLFTDGSGRVPADTAPQPEQFGPPLVPAVPVEYVGFSGSMQVNDAVLADNSLVQRGTYGATIASGSNELINRIVNNVFGSIDYQQAIGSIDLRVSANPAPNNTLQDFLGLVSENTLTGSEDLGATQYASLAALVAAGSAPGPDIFVDNLGNESDTLTITFDDPDIGTGPHVIELDLSVIAALPTAGSAGQDLINAITADPDWAAAVADFGASVTLDANGQLNIDTRSDVTIASGAVDGITTDGMAFLGIGFGSFTARDPSFEVQVGNNNSTTITIEPTDTEVELLAKLQAVPGLAVEDITLSADGFLRIRPGDDYTNPNFGGNIKITTSSFRTTNAGANAVFGAGTIPDNLTVISAFFGSFNPGPPVQDEAAVTNVTYGSETNGLLLPPIPTQNFRTDFLGPNADITTQVIGASSLVDFAQRMVNQHSQEKLLIDERQADEDTLRNILNDQLLNESGVNLDEELGQLIVMQTAYAAAARVINAVDELFTELLNAVG